MLSESQVCETNTTSSLCLTAIHPGFDYNFHALHEDTNELFSAYKNMFEISISQTQLIRTLISIYLPWVTVLFVCLAST